MGQISIVIGYMIFMILGYILTYFAHISTKREIEEQNRKDYERWLKEIEKVKESCNRVDSLCVEALAIINN